MVIDRFQWGARAIGLLAAIAALSPASVRADDPCIASLRGAGPGGIGGTGYGEAPTLELTIADAPESGGIGGTGLREEGGIGGSGLSTAGGEEEGGVGGTGLGGDDATGGIGGTAWIDARDVERTSRWATSRCFDILIRNML